MTDQTIALPRARARRRRLPRPPRFTRMQKFMLFCDAVIAVCSLSMFLTGSDPLAGLFGLATATSGIRVTFLLALNRLLEADRDMLLNGALTIAFVAAVWL